MDSMFPGSESESEIVRRMQALVDHDLESGGPIDSVVKDFAQCVAVLRQFWPDSADSHFHLAVDGSQSDGKADGAIDPPELPQRLGRFEIRRMLGHGGFGVVLLAFDGTLSREVALKIPRPEFLLAHKMPSRFLREAQAAALLDHPGIVPVFEAGEMGPVWYIAAAYVKGPSLAEWLRTASTPLAPRLTAQLVALLADAVQHAHSRGILHRDLKPSNVMLEPRDDGTSSEFPFAPKLTDFGLAKRMESTDDETRAGTMLGTPRYMAPEQAGNRYKEISVVTDVYGLGAILHELLMGQPPLVGEPNSDLLHRVEHEETPPARLRGRRVPKDMETICLKCLEMEQSRRYQTARELADDLRRYLAGEPIRARPPGPARRFVKWARRRPVTAALAGVALCAVLVVTSLVWWHNIQLRQALAETDEARHESDKLRVASQQSQRQTENMLYAADMRLATNSYFNGDRTETVARLRKYMPGATGPDRREFAWRRLWSLCNAYQRALTGHQGDVYGVQVVGDGRRLVSAGRDGTLRLWDVSSDKPGQILGTYANELNFAALALDGVTLATGSDDGTIRLFDLAAGRETGHFVGHGNWALCGAMSPLGDQLATSGRDNVIRLWAIPQGELLAELLGHTTTVESLAYLPDGKSLVSAGGDCTLRIWDIAAKTGAVIATHPVPAKCVACSHDGRRLATACEDQNIYVWDVDSRSLYGRLSGHRESVQCVAFSPDDTRLASVSVDAAVRAWDLGKLTQIESFVGHSSRVWCVAWFPDGNSLASAGADGTVRLWKAGASRLERVASLPRQVTRVCFSARGGRVWTVASKAYAWVSDLDGQPTPLAAPAQDVASARNADVLAIKTSDEQVRLYDGAGQPSSAFIELPWHIRDVALSTAGDLLAVVGHKGELHLYELPTFRLRWSRPLDDSRALSMEFTRQGDALVVAVNDGSVAEISVADGAMRVVFQPRQPWRVTASPDGRLLAASCSDRAIRIWDREQRKEVACLQGHDGVVNALAFPPDGQTLAAGTSAGSVILWHVPSWQELGSFKTSLVAINDLAFSSKGNSLAIGGRAANDGGQIILWETKAIDD
jgi:eukaryotic-like serine/threonine-protein kinase